MLELINENYIIGQVKGHAIGSRAMIEARAYLEGPTADEV